MSNVLLVTGSTSDIGVELIKNVHQNYDYIIAHYNQNKGNLVELEKKLKDKLILLSSDFLDEEDTCKVVDKIIEKGIIPNHIVHLPAGKFENIKFSKINWQKFNNDLNISLRSIVIILNKLLPIIAKEKNGKVVIMLSSCTLNIPPKYLTSYITSKYALLGLMKALSQEYAGKGITINGVSPSMIETKFLNNIPTLIIKQNAENSPTKENLKVSEVVPTIEFLLSEKANCITGQNTAITNGNIM